MRGWLCCLSEADNMFKSEIAETCLTQKASPLCDTGSLLTCVSAHMMSDMTHVTPSIEFLYACFELSK